MPEKHKTPQTEKEQNRAKILLCILGNPSLTFSELLSKTGFSRATLTSHLFALERDKLIKRNIKPRNEKETRKWTRKLKIVYDPLYDKKKLMLEIRSFGFDLMVGFLLEIEPVLGELLEAWVESSVESFISLAKTRAEAKERGKPCLSTKEELLLVIGTLRDKSSPEIRQITGIDETLRAIKQKPESSPEFQKLAEIKTRMKRRARALNSKGVEDN